MIGGQMFCIRCRTMKQVMDEYWTDDGQDPPTERFAQPLECGHDGTDTGGLPYKRRHTPDPGLVARVQQLQEGRDGGDSVA